jgi:hypothetical protein
MCRIFHSFGHELSTMYGGISANALVHMKIKPKDQLLVIFFLMWFKLHDKNMQ